MSDEAPKGESTMVMGKVAEPIAEVDELIMEVERVAQEAQRSNAQREVGEIKRKKETKAKEVEETEELQQRFAALESDDIFVEECAYEWAFDAFEKETGVAAPEGIYEKIAALRKTGDALRKLVKAEAQSRELLDWMAKLQEKHDELFEEIKIAAVDALEEVKKEHKGEESDFTKKFKGLLDSPLVKLVEYDTDSPEAREKGLKQEIMEFLLRPVVEGGLTNLEKVLAETREKLEKFETTKALYEKKSDNDDVSWQAQQLGMPGRQGLKTTSRGLCNWIGREIESLGEIVKSLETQLSRERLALGVNRMVIDESLAGEHEASLRDALVAIRDHVGILRKQGTSDVSWDFWGSQGRAPLKNRLAQKILGQYGEFGVSFPSNYKLQNSFSPAYTALTPCGQIMGEDWQPESHSRGTSPAKFLANELPNYFFSSQIPQTHEDLFRSLYTDSTNSVFEQARGFYNDVLRRQSDKQESKQTAFLAEYPTVGEFITKVFAGKGKLLNLRLAYEKVDAGIGKDERSDGPKIGAIPEELSKAGWKKSKLGAWVEPGQNAREADGEYARLLEQLSAPQIEAERAFDVRGPDGEFHVYTTEQAVRIARLLKRDAQGIIRQLEGTNAPLQEQAAADRAKIENLQRQVGTLSEQIRSLREAAVASEQQMGQLLSEIEGATKQVEQSGDSAARLNSEVARARDENLRLAEIVREAVSRLEQAQKEKSGLLGGGGKLREAIEETLRKLRGR